MMHKEDQWNSSDSQAVPNLQMCLISENPFWSISVDRKTGSLSWPSFVSQASESARLSMFSSPSKDRVGNPARRRCLHGLRSSNTCGNSQYCRIVVFTQPL